MSDILILGKYIFRNQSKEFGIKTADRRKHMYIIGKTGQGKTTFLENMIINDILNNKGLAYFDPHGDSVQKILDFIPKNRIDDVIYFNPMDINHPMGFNPLEKIQWEQRHLIALSLLSVFKKIWVDAWSARMEYILLNALLALMEIPGATMLDINRMLGDKNFRKMVVANLKDSVVKNFWLKEFEKYHQQFQVEAVAPIQNKVGQFITNPLIRNIIGQKESTFNLREILEGKKIFLANLSLGAIGEATSSLLGGLLISKLQLSAMSRVDLPEDKREDFYLYVDEFQNFATDSFVNILSEARKYGLNLIISHQYLDQIDEKIRKSIFGNIGTFIIFRLGTVDAEIFSKELNNIVTVDNLINLPAYHIYVKLLIDGEPSPPFLATTIPPAQKPDISYKEEILAINHLKYAKKRASIEKIISETFKDNINIDRSKIKTQQCTVCGKEFELYLDEEDNVCLECKNQIRGGISLKKAIEKGIVIMQPKKQTQKETIPDPLDEILKKLNEENNK